MSGHLTEDQTLLQDAAERYLRDNYDFNQRRARIADGCGWRVATTEAVVGRAAGYETSERGLSSLLESSGGNALVAAISMCEHVSVYGYG